MAVVLWHSCCSVVALCSVGCWLLWLLVGAIMVWALASILVVICCWWHFVLVAFYLAAYNSMDSTAVGVSIQQHGHNSSWEHTSATVAGVRVLPVGSIPRVWLDGVSIQQHGHNKEIEAYITAFLCEGVSGTSLLHVVSLIAYNVFYTSVPVLVSLVDKDLSEGTVMQHLQILYYCQAERKYCISWNLGTGFLLSVAQILAVVIKLNLDHSRNRLLNPRTFAGWFGRSQFHVMVLSSADFFLQIMQMASLSQGRLLECAIGEGKAGRVADPGGAEVCDGSRAEGGVGGEGFGRKQGLEQSKKLWLLDHKVEKKMELIRKLTRGCFMDRRRMGLKVEFESVNGGEDVFDVVSADAKVQPEHLVIMVNGIVGR
ncbi:Phospholipid-transporting ATPase 2 [Camellia lanceoleosa]|uniref:Phospholipid-transporting ATPase 2 n=1 Tax=Camellia lanceoleosa TaxID=1840588 RepID=A0ACC0HLU6_9ERIC|nr:Phospholipid-transporting ATPase 2 [Camellia lanceoleosa]